MADRWRASHLFGDAPIRIVDAEAEVEQLEEVDRW
jgi:hypothetical protein